MALIHSVYAVVLPGYMIFTEGVFRDSVKNTDLQMFILESSSGYFVYDWIGANIGGLNALLDNVHHFVTLLGLLFGAMLGEAGSYLCTALFLVETSNPFYHTRHMLRLHHFDRKPAFAGVFKVCERMFALTFLVGRIIFGSWFTFRTLMSPLIVVRQIHMRALW